jgi:hypothetical protein
MKPVLTDLLLAILPHQLGHFITSSIESSLPNMYYLSRILSAQLEFQSDMGKVLVCQ